MAKLGRYSADRKKIKNLACGQTAGADGDNTNVTHDIEAAQCGTVFTLTPAVAADKGGATITLPTVADAGKGWWVKFVLLGPIPGDTNNNDDLGIIIQNDASDANDMVVHIPADSGADGAGHIDGASVKFVEGSAAAGDEVEVICDGSVFLIACRAAVSGGITKA